ncbi:hypothetical protein TUM19329_25910 [Legionella antarctica]|uniref:Uncharacterized protein n=1 Tax=Legionella antarctica TaxID=2708020 RepID=A0A6F8T7W1_9GAMM|nr:BrxA family protein [Legionella antarctica]BCA96230.1 hypothetical protein TUM19329_25910 [Legionella antarctica]
MSLEALFETVFENYKKFENGDVQALTNSFKLYEAISPKEIQAELSSNNLFTVRNCNEALLLLAKSYIDYAFARINTLRPETAEKILEKASQCYKHIIRAVAKISSSNLSLEVGQQSTETKYYMHKVKFQKAEMRLFFIKKQMHKD